MLEQMAKADLMALGFLKILPAFPKPHLFKADGVWYCVRHAYQDEFVTVSGVTPKAAFNGGDMLLDTEAVMRDAPTWMDGRHA